MTATATVTRFAALRDRYSRPYLFAAGLAMMGDNIEHVITYWVLWQKFHSTALTGFEVISHWLPFLLLSVTFGGFAQRFDCRRLIQIAQLLFMAVSITWGILFATDSLQIWMACVLLVLHGCAGSLWGPAEQLLLHDFAEPKDLPGAIRMNATFRSLGVLFGPAVGSALLLGLGPQFGIWANVLFYLPMTILMFRTPYTGHTRDGALMARPAFVRDAAQSADAVRQGDGARPATLDGPADSLRETARGVPPGGPVAEAGSDPAAGSTAAPAPPPKPSGGILGAIRTLREVQLGPVVVSMIALSGLTALFVGGALQVSMPEFAVALGAGGAGLAYGILLFANGIGAVLGGFLLEAIGVLKPNALTAIIGTTLYGAFILLFATTGSYIVAVVALVIAGVANMASLSVTQSIVQLEAKPQDRGRVVGLYGTVSSGFRTGSGIIIAVLGAFAGLRGSLALSAAVLTLGALVIGGWTWWARRRAS